MRKHKYSDKLGQPMSSKAALEAAQSGKLEEWLAQEWSQRLILLCEHYGISSSHPSRFGALCMVLAVNHVPGFSVNATKVRKAAEEMKPRRPRGRPRTRQELMAGMPTLVDHVKVVHRLGGRGSERRALELLINGMARAQGRSQTIARQKTLSYFQKILSKARRANSQKS